MAFGSQDTFYLLKPGAITEGPGPIYMFFICICSRMLEYSLLKIMCNRYEKEMIFAFSLAVINGGLESDSSRP